MTTEARPFAPGRSPRELLSADTFVVRSPQAHLPGGPGESKSSVKENPPSPFIPSRLNSYSVHPLSSRPFHAKAVLTEDKLEELKKSLHQDLESSANLRSVSPRDAASILHACARVRLTQRPHGVPMNNTFFFTNGRIPRAAGGNASCISPADRLLTRKREHGQRCVLLVCNPHLCAQVCIMHTRDRAGDDALLHSCNSGFRDDARILQNTTSCE